MKRRKVFLKAKAAFKNQNHRRRLRKEQQQRMRVRQRQFFMTELEDSKQASWQLA